MDKLVFDSSRLLGKIKEKGMTQADAANAAGMSLSSLSFKLTGKRYFTQPEIVKIAAALDIQSEEIADYFFTPRNAKTQV